MKQCLVIACVVIMASCNDAPQNTGTAAPPKQEPQVNVVINIAARQLAVLRGTDTLRMYPIAVGQPKYPTPTGNFKIHQIDWNPDWTPPDSDWTEGKEHTPPAHPENPMGRARIVYQKPYSIHGTKDLSSLGEDESHGSVRMANSDVIDLAKYLMKESGTEKPESWYQNVLTDSTKMVSIKLNTAIPLVNK